MNKVMIAALCASTLIGCDNSSSTGEAPATELSFSTLTSATSTETKTVASESITSATKVVESVAAVDDFISSFSSKPSFEKQTANATTSCSGGGSYEQVFTESGQVSYTSVDSYSNCVISELTLNGSGSAELQFESSDANYDYSNFSINAVVGESAYTVTLNNGFSKEAVTGTSNAFTVNNFTVVENDGSSTTESVLASGSITVTDSTNDTYVISNLVVESNSFSSSGSGSSYITLSTTTDMVFADGVNLPTSGVLVISGADDSEITIDTDTGNVATAYVSVNGGTASQLTFSTDLGVESLRFDLDYVADDYVSIEQVF